MKPLHKLWPELEALVDKGYTKSIGVSNFNTQLIWDLLTYARIKPVVNQIELNPQNAQTELIRFLIANDIRPVAYTPICRIGHEKSHDFTQEDLMKTLAAKYNKSVPQIMLNWGISRGCVVIPKAASLDHQIENADIFDFALTEEEVKSIEGLNQNLRLCNKMPFFDKYDLFA